MPDEPKRTMESQSEPEHLAVEDRRLVWESVALLGEENEAVIVHRGQLYRLRCTRQGKLILYK